MIKRSTWITLVLFVIAIAGYVILKGHGSSSLAAPTATEVSYKYLINSTDGTLVSLRIYDSNYHVVQLQRDSTGTWIVIQPMSSPADQSLAGAAESQVGALKILSTINTQLSLKEIGLDFPAYTMQFAFSGGKKHIIEVGLSSPVGTGYYVRFDAGGIYVISKDGIDSLVNLLSSPPYPATETPVPTVELSNTPILEVTAMPATTTP